ncbi:hypothetical protein RO3G_00495 [Rhizopus delemar RA 99-880]|uniref:Uncharacterized protein n=1 Tax=Rhizopus delemar (strain RA 99-880 / ATCC MYA-4621 / FGSC 9543 / NRRL 43880) TaxID=246409 RepID=I1BHW1_RHIO9|nr:hypothetical protein RO3G_00490 [Rhizopus delemar RA 99-880]EIE75791.1 hypothetical protein RO3G_00495 [Rhizopus delemar RA 99-880]|eukprot:EIE75786.1 hypothetical protein RO3G_00490 [Rhizopus delemar RA 99-880]
MRERVAILQAQFLFRTLSLPEDTLLYRLMPHIQYTRGHQWYKLSKTALWKLMPPTIADLDTRGFRAIKKKFLHSNLEKQIQDGQENLFNEHGGKVYDPVEDFLTQIDDPNIVLETITYLSAKRSEKATGEPSVTKPLKSMIRPENRLSTVCLSNRKSVF